MEKKLSINLTWLYTWAALPHILAGFFLGAVTMLSLFLVNWEVWWFFTPVQCTEGFLKTCEGYGGVFGRLLVVAATLAGWVYSIEKNKGVK